jgi:branched-subunit amino acid ABC-type transport system permease component
LFNFLTKEIVMNKLNLAVVALILAVLGGCASNPGDVVGTGFTGYSESNNPTQPYPIGSLIQTD